MNGNINIQKEDRKKVESSTGRQHITYSNRSDFHSWKMMWKWKCQKTTWTEIFLILTVITFSLLLWKFKTTSVALGIVCLKPETIWIHKGRKELVQLFLMLIFYIRVLIHCPIFHSNYHFTQGGKSLWKIVNDFLHDWVSGLYLNIQEIDSSNQPFFPTAKNMSMQLYSQSKLSSTSFIIDFKLLH